MGELGVRLVFFFSTQFLSHHSFWTPRLLLRARLTMLSLKLSENVESILTAVRSGSKQALVGSSSSDFQFMAHALVGFMDNEGGGE